MGMVLETVAKQYNNLILSQKNYREAVNFEKIKVAVAHKVCVVEREYYNGGKDYYERENMKQVDQNKWSSQAMVIGEDEL